MTTTKRVYHRVQPVRAIKRPANAFLQYARLVRLRILDKEPHLKACEVVKRAATLWNDEQPEVKKRMQES